MNRGVVVLTLASSVTFAMVGVGSFIRPLRRLGPRVRPYIASSRTGLGLAPDPLGYGRPGVATEKRTGRWLMTPLVASFLDRVSRIFVTIDEERLALMLRQSGLYPDLEDGERPRAYRMGVMARVALFATGLAAISWLAGNSGARVSVLGLAGGVLGAVLGRSRLEEGVRRQRDSIRSEMYTINQLIAMYMRVGGGAIEAIRHVVLRARGVMVDELADVLVLHERGWSLKEALERAERLTPEPQAARTYRLMSTSQERGADLAEALLDLSKDLRAGRRNDLRRRAARRRILMVIPIVVILAPVTMLFIAAPIPFVVFGG